MKTKFEISADLNCVKERIENNENYCKTDKIRHRQQMYQRVDYNTTNTWKKVIAEIKPDASIKVWYFLCKCDRK